MQAKRIVLAAHPLHLFGGFAIGLQQPRELVANADAGCFLGHRSGRPVPLRRGDGAVERLRLGIPIGHRLPAARLDRGDLAGAALVLVIEIAADPAAVLVAPDLACLGVGLAVAVPLDHRRRGRNLFVVARRRVEHRDAILLAIGPAHRLVPGIPVVEPVRRQPPARQISDRILHLAPANTGLSHHQPGAETGDPANCQGARSYGSSG